MVREIGVAATFDADHDVYYGRTCGDGFAVVSDTGLVTVLDSRLRLVRRVDLGAPAPDLSVAGDRWAWVVGERLWVGDPATGGVSAPLRGESACRWQPSGQALWSARGTGDEVLVELRTPDNRVTGAVTVPDAFGDSMVRLRRHPHEGAIILWLTAGQDGQQSWLIRDDGTVDHLPADDCLPAQFCATTDWFLAAGDDHLTRLSWPAGAELGTLKWSEIDPQAAADGSDVPGGCLMWLPDGFVSWSTENGRLRTIDPTTMTVADEIQLAGHTGFSFAVPHDSGDVMSVHGPRTLVLSTLRDWPPV